MYTDGACKGNPGKGGWGAILKYGNHERVLWGSEHKTTNNRMEMTAALEALRAIKYPCKVLLHSDSALLVNTFTKNWKRRANKDLWEPLEEECRRHHVTWIKVKAHATDPLNNRVDRIASEAALGQR